MFAIVRKTDIGFATQVINDDMTQPTQEEQEEFMNDYARAVMNLHVETTTK
jgi:hypothetical protein